MPINKDALKRYRIIDEKLSDPYRLYTTKDICQAVNMQCENVSLRMIQKDLNTIETYFDKPLLRNVGRRGVVRYKDQSQPLFYKQLTSDEENMLREILKSLGQFDGLDNFTWLDLLKKKLEMTEDAAQQPYISFSRNEGLQIPETLLGRLFTAIARKKVIRFRYTRFGAEKKEYTVYPYQLKQYNDRWFLLCTPTASKEFPYDSSFIANFALDRMDGDFDYVENEPYLETPVDFKERFDEIIGVTLYADKKLEDIYFAVSPAELPYVETKALHYTQMKLAEEFQLTFRQRYPSLKTYTFFTITCRENPELYQRFSSYGPEIVLVEPAGMRQKMQEIFRKGAENYSEL